ncbi:hypothetical protein [Oceanibium sediminis]|uniref:hypothetical protein n=1 Tax=Oceanibium sediminis TaxID=2026339 RepID=UPI0018E4ECE4|nr:hypothetical protein [Oceanibium sediminis]
MNAIINTLKTSARKRRAYNRTVAALSAMNIDTRLDLDIYEGDIRKIARNAVYGA